MPSHCATLPKIPCLYSSLNNRSLPCRYNAPLTLLCLRETALRFALTILFDGSPCLCHASPCSAIALQYALYFACARPRITMPLHGKTLQYLRPTRLNIASPPQRIAEQHRAVAYLVNSLLPPIISPSSFSSSQTNLPYPALRH